MNCLPIELDQFLGVGTGKCLVLHRLSAKVGQSKPSSGGAFYFFYMLNAPHIYSFYISGAERLIL
jgi:hypothetical protein